MIADNHGKGVDYQSQADNSLLVNAVQQLSWPDQDVAVWAACEFHKMRSLRRYFRDIRKLNSERLYISSYWKLDRTDEQHKQDKKTDPEAWCKLAVVDRCFISEGTQWVIDYKAAEPLTGESQESFIQRETTLYREQLEHYAKLFEQMGNYPVKTALYFPLISHLAIIWSLITTKTLNDQWNQTIQKA